MTFGVGRYSLIKTNCVILLSQLVQRKSYLISCLALVLD